MPRLRIAFFGTPEFATPTLEALARAGHEIVLVVAQPDRPSGRGMEVHSPPVAVTARAHSMPLVQPAAIRRDEFLDSVRSLAPDIGVVVAYGRILPPSLLAIPRFGFLNIHGSILPKYRGAAPIQRAIEAGETVTGVTIMSVDAELDHGPVFATSETAIGPDEHAPQLSERLSRLGADLLTEIIDEVPKMTPREQDHSAATHAPKLEKHEGEVDWHAAAKAIYDRYRAFDPWPGLFTKSGGQIVKLLELERRNGSGEPGTIVSIEAGSIIVATGDGALALRRVQLPGRKPIAGDEMARASGLRAGDRLA